MARGDNEKAAVLTAFFAARAANRPAFECYKAGVAVWKCMHPEQAPGYAAKAAVQVILDAVVPDMMSVVHEGIRRPGTEPGDLFASPAHREAAGFH
jgi:hypothetical protein